MLNKLSLLLIYIVASFQLPAQYKVRFMVREKLAPVHDSIYITGYFNNWNPGDSKYLLKPVDAVHKSIIVDLPGGLCEFKFTRGNWPTVQKNHLCGEMENTRVVIHRDTVINLDISTWFDECTTEHFLEVLKTQQEDTNKVNSLIILCMYQNGLEESLQYANDALSLAKKIKFRKGEGLAYSLMGYNYSEYKNYSEARKALLKAVQIQEEIEDKSQVANTYLGIANTYEKEGNYPEAQQNTYTAIKFFEQSGDKLGMANAYSSIGDYESFEDDSVVLKSYQLALQLYEEVGGGYGIWGIAYASDKIASIYIRHGKYREALEKDSLALKIYKELASKSSIANTLITIGIIFQRQSDLFSAAGDKKASQQKLDEALQNYQMALKLYEEQGNVYGIHHSYQLLGSINIKLNNQSTARDYLEKSLKFYKEQNNIRGLENIYFELSRLDSIQGNHRQAYNNYKRSIFYRDTLNNEEIKKKMIQTKMQYLFDKKEALVKAGQDKKDEQARRIRNQQYFAIAALAIVVLAVIVIASIQYRNNRHKQKANVLLQQQKEKVENTLSELKSTQSQLIQAEKMASLGELTAGIAHEIQNPLNFVNNFSEVSNELIAEMVEEADKGNIREVKSIALDVQQNLDKILHHGKRADSIVKGMLQHSRTSTGQKEPTDINALADEYLRLAYHGFRAKDKSFNAQLKTSFDPAVGKINVIPQDIGRVLVNLINNAFHTVSAKAADLSTPLPDELATADSRYEPTITISTKKSGDKVEIRIQDNGNGIPQKILDKIFQPFFTTKPTGQGTGLGLSLAYDIVKAHGGELKVVTNEGEGAEFIIQLPA